MLYWFLRILELHAQQHFSATEPIFLYQLHNSKVCYISEKILGILSNTPEVYQIQIEIILYKCCQKHKLRIYNIAMQCGIQIIQKE